MVKVQKGRPVNKKKTKSIPSKTNKQTNSDMPIMLPILANVITTVKDEVRI